MASRVLDLERRTLLVQFVAVAPLTFYATSDGTDLVQNILHSQLARTDADIFGQEGSVSIDDNGEFLTFEPVDTKNRTLHLPIEHLAYSGALRRMHYDPSDHRNPDQIQKREFENVDLANRYAHYIVGPPIFVAVFHGFDNALCYTFITQSADDACLLVMKIMRAFRQYEQQLEEQGHANQGPSPHIPMHNGGSPSVIEGIHGNLPLHHSSQAVSTDNRHLLSPPTLLRAPNMYNENLYQDDFIQQLLRNPNLQIVNQPYSSSSASQNAQHIDGYPFLPATEPLMCYPSINQPTTVATQQNSSVAPTMLCTSGSIDQLIGGSTSFPMQPPSPPIFGVTDPGLSHSLSMGHAFPQQLICRPNNQELNYKQNVIVRWLQPPTPPTPAPIIIREIQCPPTVLPPIICRQPAPCPPTPPPIIVRERPPPYPPPGNPLIIEKRLPPACLPRQVIVQQCPPPPPKPQAVIYEKYLPPPPPPQRQVIVQRETCQQTGCGPGTRPVPCRRLVREVIRQVPQQCAPVCTPQTQQTITPGQSQVVQQFVPVFAQRQHVVQPKGVRVIRQVIGPAQPCAPGQYGMQQAIPQMYSVTQ